MKRTIRKKIMRDLQATFVSPGSPAPAPALLARPAPAPAPPKLLGHSEPNILDMLRDSQDSGHDSPHRY